MRAKENAEFCLYRSSENQNYLYIGIFDFQIFIDSITDPLPYN